MSSGIEQPQGQPQSSVSLRTRCAEWAQIIGLIAILPVIAGIWVAFHPQTKSRTVDEFESNKRQLKVGYIPCTNMASMEASSGKVDGLLIRTCMVFAKKLKLKESDVKFVEVNWDSYAQRFESNEFQLCMAGMFPPERARRVAFTRPLFYLGNGALVRTDDNRFQSLTDIRELDRPDITIAVVSGEQAYEFVKNFKKATLKTNQVAVCDAVNQGQADVALSDQYTLSRYVKEHPAVHDLFEGRPYSVAPICWAVRTNDDTAWLDEVNRVLDELDRKGLFLQAQPDFPMIPFAAAPANNRNAYTTEYRTSPADYVYAFLSGIGVTLIVSAGAIVIGTALGIAMAFTLSSRKRGLLLESLRYILRAYIYVFLSVPALVLIIVLYYSNWLPGLSATSAAILALGLNLSPFAATIIAQGIANIPAPQIDAARAFGYTNTQVAFKFKLPLALVSIRQPLLVQYFTTIKLSSLASVIGVAEVLHRSQQVIRETYRTGEVYLIMVLCYMLIVIPLAVLADRYERRSRIIQGR